MKIEIKIPDFVPPTRIIYIMAGVEKIGYIEPHTRQVFVKVSQCSRCGKCCALLKCPHLVKDVGDNDLWSCDHIERRPFICCASEPTSVAECTSKYEAV